METSYFPLKEEPQIFLAVLSELCRATCCYYPQQLEGRVEIWEELVIEKGYECKFQLSLIWKHTEVVVNAA